MMGTWWVNAENPFLLLSCKSKCPRTLVCEAPNVTEAGCLVLLFILSMAMAPPESRLWWLPQQKLWPQRCPNLNVLPSRNLGILSDILWDSYGIAMGYSTVFILWDKLWDIYLPVIKSSMIFTSTPPFNSGISQSRLITGGSMMVKR